MCNGKTIKRSLVKFKIVKIGGNLKFQIILIYRAWCENNSDNCRMKMMVAVDIVDVMMIDNQIGERNASIFNENVCGELC